jgi:hypothetical protein
MFDVLGSRFEVRDSRLFGGDGAWAFDRMIWGQDDFLFLSLKSFCPK